MKGNIVCYSGRKKVLIGVGERARNVTKKPVEETKSEGNAATEIRRNRKGAHGGRERKGESKEQGGRGVAVICSSLSFCVSVSCASLLSAAAWLPLTKKAWVWRARPGSRSHGGVNDRSDDIATGERGRPLFVPLFSFDPSFPG